MTPSETAELLAVIADAFPGRFSCTAGTLRVWAVMLEDTSWNDAQAALREYLCTGVHPPAIADIRTRVAARQLCAPDIAQAWPEVMRAIARVGRYGQPTWSSPLVAAAVESIGWLALCGTHDDALPTVRAQFERYLRARSQAAAHQANAGALDARDDARTGELRGAGDVIKLALAGVKKP